MWKRMSCDFEQRMTEKCGARIGGGDIHSSSHRSYRQAILLVKRGKLIKGIGHVYASTLRRIITCQAEGSRPPLGVVSEVLERIFKSTGMVVVERA